MDEDMGGAWATVLGCDGTVTAHGHAYDAMHRYSHGRVGVHPNAWRQGILFSQPFTISIFSSRTAENLLQEVRHYRKTIMCRRPGTMPTTKKSELSA
jgi:hypothetical protein